MFLGMSNTRLKRKILKIFDFENGFLPAYLPLCVVYKIKIKFTNLRGRRWAFAVSMKAAKTRTNNAKKATQVDFIFWTLLVGPVGLWMRYQKSLKCWFGLRQGFYRH